MTSPRSGKIRTKVTTPPRSTEPYARTELKKTPQKSPASAAGSSSSTNTNTALTPGLVAMLRLKMTPDVQRQVAEQDLSQRAQRHAARKEQRGTLSDPDAYQPPRPRNSFMIYRGYWHDLVRDCVQKYYKLDKDRSDTKVDSQLVSMALSQIWRDSTDAFKDYYTNEAFLEKKWHADMYPGYKYRPKKTTKPKVTRVTKNREQKRAEAKRITALMKTDSTIQQSINALEKEIKNQSDSEISSAPSSPVPTCIVAPTWRHEKTRRDPAPRSHTLSVNSARWRPRSPSYLDSESDDDRHVRENSYDSIYSVYSEPLAGSTISPLDTMLSTSSSPDHHHFYMNSAPVSPNDRYIHPHMMSHMHITSPSDPVLSSFPTAQGLGLSNDADTEWSSSFHSSRLYDDAEVQSIDPKLLMEDTTHDIFSGTARILAMATAPNLYSPSARSSSSDRRRTRLDVSFHADDIDDMDILDIDSTSEPDVFDVARNASPLPWPEDVSAAEQNRTST